MSEQTTKKRFDELADAWESATINMSSPAQKTTHPNYLKIIAMGGYAIDLILDRIEERPGDWFVALQILTDDDPVPASHHGDIQAMTSDWLQWGASNGYGRNG